MTKAASSALDAVEHYKKKLTRHIDDPDPSVMLHCLAKLDRVPMTFDILQVRTRAMHCLKRDLAPRNQGPSFTTPLNVSPFAGDRGGSDCERPEEA